MKRILWTLLLIILILAGCRPPQAITITAAAVTKRPITVTVTPRAETAVTPTIEVTPTPTATVQPTRQPSPQEQPVITIPLAGPIADSRAEISGMAWYGDWLILMPQYPDFAARQGDGFLYALRKADIYAVLNGEIEGLKAVDISLRAPGLRANVAGYEGFEAIVFAGSRAFLTIEASPSTGMRGYLVAGTMAEDMSELVLDTAVLTTIPSQNNVSNKSDEALFTAGDQIITLFETNGTAVTTNPVAHRFDRQLTAVDTIPIPPIPYRLTDVTELDKNGRFWAINYFFPGDTELAADVDFLADQHGLGMSHQQYDHVERLLQFQYHEDGIELTDTPPIQLKLMAQDARNWEGLARLDDRGFLLVTDKYPETILGFVPLPESQATDDSAEKSHELHE